MPVGGMAGRKSRGAANDPRAGMKSQKSDALKAELLPQGKLFEDPEFIARDSTIFFSHALPKPYEWKRPGVSGNINL